MLPRETHIWYVRVGHQILLEAGNPANSWVKDLADQQSIYIRGEGLEGEYSFSLHKDNASHLKIRSHMRAAYGWRDWWVALLFDTSQSAMVEVFPL